MEMAKKMHLQVQVQELGRESWWQCWTSMCVSAMHENDVTEQVKLESKLISQAMTTIQLAWLKLNALALEWLEPMLAWKPRPRVKVQASRQHSAAAAGAAVGQSATVHPNGLTERKRRQEMRLLLSHQCEQRCPAPRVECCRGCDSTKLPRHSSQWTRAIEQT
jgi:hypothetical protein